MSVPPPLASNHMCVSSLWLGQRFGVPLEFVAVAKPFKFQVGEEVSSLLSALNWELYDDAVVSGSPLYLHDGDLMLFRDIREIPKSVPEPGAGPHQVFRFLTHTQSCSFLSFRPECEARNQNGCIPIDPAQGNT